MSFQDSPSLLPAREREGSEIPLNGCASKEASRTVLTRGHHGCVGTELGGGVGVGGGSRGWNEVVRSREDFLGPRCLLAL